MMCVHPAVTRVEEEEEVSFFVIVTNEDPPNAHQAQYNGALTPYFSVVCGLSPISPAASVLILRLPSGSPYPCRVCMCSKPLIGQSSYSP